MSALTPDARRLVATSGANVIYPAVTEEELGNEQLLLDNYRRTIGAKRIAYACLGGTMLWWLYDYLRVK